MINFYAFLNLYTNLTYSNSTVPYTFHCYIMWSALRLTLLSQRDTRGYIFGATSCERWKAHFQTDDFQVRSGNFITQTIPPTGCCGLEISRQACEKRKQERGG